MTAYYITIYAGREPIAPIATRPIPLERAIRIARMALDRRIPATHVTMLDMRTGRVVFELDK